MINGSRGVVGAKGWHFNGEMRYKFTTDCDGPARWRVTTLGYRYRLSLQGREIFLFHWHPNGRSPETNPHIHVRVDGVADSLDKHLVCERTTLEQAIRYSIELGFPPAQPEWKAILDECETPHLAHRSWGGRGGPMPVV